MRAIVTFGLGLVLLACGGKAHSSTLDVAPTAGADGSTMPSHPPCASADGIRLCGGVAACPWLDVSECPGAGCTAASDINSGAISTGGICWSDLPDKGVFDCSQCSDGEVCIQRDAQRLICVSAAVCEALWDDGLRDVCRYADKSPYDHQTLPEPSGACPGGPHSRACGGACPACVGGGPCVGRSPGRPFGVCNVPSAEVPASDPGAFESCSHDSIGPLARWCDPHDSREVAACAVFKIAGADMSVSNRYGVCVAADICAATVSGFPGGLDCFDAAGVLLATTQ